MRLLIPLAAAAAASVTLSTIAPSYLDPSEQSSQGHTSTSDGGGCEDRQSAHSAAECDTSFVGDDTRSIHSDNASESFDPHVIHHANTTIDAADVNPGPQDFSVFSQSHLPGKRFANLTITRDSATATEGKPSADV